MLQEETTVATIIPQIAQAKNQIQISATQLATYLGDRTADQIEVIGRSTFRTARRSSKT